MFQDRVDAGRQLARKLVQFNQKEHTAVCGLLRGGIVVAYEVAKDLRLPLSALIVRKISSEKNPELALGAITHNTVYWDQDLLDAGHISLEEKEKSFEKAKKEAEIRAVKLSLPPLKPIDTIIVVDDGVATGATAIVASLYLKQFTHVLYLATPLISKDISEKLQQFYKTVYCLRSEDNFRAVSQFYREFPQVEDSEVLEILRTNQDTHE